MKPSHHLRIIFVICSLCLISFFIYKLLKPKGFCKLTNQSNICYINSVIQALFSIKEFNKFILDQKHHENEKIKTLSKLFRKMNSESELNALPLYKIIFNGTLEFQNEPGAFDDVFLILKELILSEFPNQKFFINSQLFDNFYDFSFTDHKKLFFYVPDCETEQTIRRYLNQMKTEDFPKLMIMNYQVYNLLSDNKKVSECHLSVSVQDIKYSLVGLIVLTELKGNAHVYSNCKRKDGWYKMNDIHIDKIRKDRIHKEVCVNPQMQIALYYMEDGLN